jgi:hypothetical protein
MAQLSNLVVSTDLFPLDQLKGLKKSQIIDKIYEHYNKEEEEVVKEKEEPSSPQKEEKEEKDEDDEEKEEEKDEEEDEEKEEEEKEEEKPQKKVSIMEKPEIIEEVIEEMVEFNPPELLTHFSEEQVEDIYEFVEYLIQSVMERHR